MEEPIDPHAAAPARSMHQAPAARGPVDAKKEVGVPHCSVHGVDQGIHASRPASSSSSSYKVVAPSSSAHGVDQGVDASQPTGSKSSSYKVDAPSSSAHGVDQGIDPSRPGEVKVHGVDSQATAPMPFVKCKTCEYLRMQIDLTPRSDAVLINALRPRLGGRFQF